MKMFKKLMAVALAGVMALVVLTGCASNAVSTKEILACINDTAARHVNVKFVAAQNDDEAKAAMKIFQTYKAEHKEAEIEEVFNNSLEKVAEQLKARANTKENICVGYAKVDELTSQSLKERQNKDLAEKLLHNMKSLNYRTWKNDATGTISMQMDKIGDDTYIVAVIHVPAVEE